MKTFFILCFVGNYLKRLSKITQRPFLLRSPKKISRKLHEAVLTGLQFSLLDLFLKFVIINT